MKGVVAVGRGVGRLGWRLALTLTLALGLTGAWPGTALAKPGDLDPGFSSGIVQSGFVKDSRDEGFGVAQQSNGKLVMVGRTGKDLGLIRFNTDGSLDGSFGSDGRVTTDLGGKDVGGGVAIQNDGKIVVVGNSKVGGNRNIVLMRYEADGSLDSGFGSGGKVVLDLTSKDRGVAVAIDANQKIVLLGEAKNQGTKTDFVLARYGSNGSPDNGFGTNGRVVTDGGNSRADLAHGLALAGDKIVAAGSSSGSSTDFLVIRYNPDGSLDGSFDGDGRALIDLEQESDDQANAVAVAPDGKIVVVGPSSGNEGGDPEVAVVRLKADGSLDDTFSGDGKRFVDARESTPDIATGVAIQSDEKIVVSGTTLFEDKGSFFVLRLRADGETEQGFGDKGVEVTDFFQSDDRASALLIQNDGKLVVAGTTDAGRNGDFGLVRYLAQ